MTDDDINSESRAHFWSCHHLCRNPIAQMLSLVAAALLLPCVLSSPVPSADLNALQSSHEASLKDSLPDDAEFDTNEVDGVDMGDMFEAESEAGGVQIHIGEHMTPKEYEAAVVKLQQSSAGSSSGSEYSSGTIGNVRQDCEACISAQHGSITAHSVRPRDDTLHFPDSLDHARVADAPPSRFG